MKINNFTLFVPVRDRHENLKRICHYYSDLECDKLIVDSSITQYDDVDLLERSGFRYVYFGPIPYIQMMTMVYNKLISNKFVVDCPDDDIILKESLFDCVNFLSSNDDYVACEGEVIWFDSSNSRLWNNAPNKFFGPLKANFHSNSGRKRVIFEYNCCYTRQHSVLRTDAMKKFWNLLKTKSILHPICFIERFHVFIMAVLGNSKKIPVIHMIRNKNSDHIWQNVHIQKETNPDINFIDNLDKDHLDPFVEVLMEVDPDLNYDDGFVLVRDLIKNQLEGGRDLCSIDTEGWKFRKEWDHIRQKYLEEVNYICQLMMNE